MMTIKTYFRKINDNDNNDNDNNHSIYISILWKFQMHCFKRSTAEKLILCELTYPPDVKVTYLYDCRTNEYFKNIIFDNNDGDNNEDDNNGDIDNENMYTYFGDDDCRRN